MDSVTITQQELELLYLEHERLPCPKLTFHFWLQKKWFGVEDKYGEDWFDKHVHGVKDDQ